MARDRQSLFDRLVAQLDTLVPFLALAHGEVFDLIRHDHGVWLSRKAERSLPESYLIYRRQVTHGAFLLGYSYSEAFLADLVREIYISNPRMLPEEKQLTFGELRKVRCYKAVVRSMIEKEVASVFAQRMQEIANYFERKLTLSWPNGLKEKAIMASLLRNCIIHNLGRADSRLGEVSHYSVGDTIALEPRDVHSYGLSARALGRHLYEQAQSAFLSRKKK
jgi:hypothetical protein